MFSELSNQIKAQLYDRARSPLLSTFTFSWIAWNFRTVIVFFSDDALAVKLNNLDILYPTLEVYLTRGLGFPILSTVLFIFLYPYPAKIAYRHWQKQHALIKKIQQEIEDATPLTQEEALALRKAALEQQIALQAQVRTLSNANRELATRETQLIEVLEKARHDLNETINGRVLLEQQKSEALQNVAALEKERTSLMKRIKQYNSDEKVPSPAVVSRLKKAVSKTNKLPTQTNFWDGLTKNPDLKELVDRFITFCLTRDISQDMATILYWLVMGDGRVGISKLAELLEPNLSRIEVDNLINKLKHKDFVIGNDNIFLTDKGKAFSVSSELTTLVKQVRQPTRIN
jgi:hypothetical protein